MAEPQVERRLAAILCADVVGYSWLIARDEAGTIGALKSVRHNVVNPMLARHHGRLVQTTGDGTLVEFASVVDAVLCAAALQEAAAQGQVEVPPERRLVLRIERQRALSWADRALSIEPDDHLTLYNVACIYSLLGLTDEAMQLLEPTTPGASAHRVAWMRQGDDLAPLRQHSRYVALLRRLGSQA